MEAFVPTAPLQSLPAPLPRGAAAHKVVPQSRALPETQGPQGAAPALALGLAGGLALSFGTRRAVTAKKRSSVAVRATADRIEEAAATLSKKAYPFMQQVKWGSDEFLLTPGNADPIGWTEAIAKIIDMGASMDAELVKAGCEAHSAAIHGLSSDGVCSEGQLTQINSAIGRMIASVPEDKTMDVYHAVSALVDPKVPDYLMSTVNEADARAAYDALIEFVDVVKANPIAPTSHATSVSSTAADSISAAASHLSRAAYPFMKSVEWTDDLYAKRIPDRAVIEKLRAVEKMIAMGSKMDGAALREAASAHVKAIEHMDDKGVLTPEDFEAILAGLGKAISSVPESTVMGVYGAMRNLVGTQIPSFVYAKQTPAEAMEAYSALVQFKDTVRAYQPDAIGDAAAKLAKASYPFMQEVPWNSDEFLLTPGQANPIGWAKAIAKIISMGASMDSGLVKAGCEAHHAACVGLPANGVCSEDELTAIYAAIGRMIASVPESQTLGVYSAVAMLVDPKVPQYLMSKVSEKNARAAYDAVVEFAGVVKANPIKPFTTGTTVTSDAARSISAAAKNLATAAYPFMAGVDWTDDLYKKPIPGKSAQEIMKAVDKMIVMGSQMDGAALQEAASAHVGAIQCMDSKGVLLEQPIGRSAFAELASRRYRGEFRISVDDQQPGNPRCQGRACPRLTGPSHYCRGWNLRGHLAWQWGCPFDHPEEVRPTHGAAYSLERVPRSTAKFDEIETELLQSAPFFSADGSTGRPRIAAVRRVNNPALQRLYNERRGFLHDKHGFTVEKELWHGTNCKALPELLTHGLQPPSDTRPSEACPRSGGKGLCTTLCGASCPHCCEAHAWGHCHMYGLGVYLADLARKSHRYVREPGASRDASPTDGGWQIILAGKWQSFEEEWQSAFDAAQASGMKVYGFRSRGWDYHVDFERMLQVNLSTRRERQVRRLDPSAKGAAAAEASPRMKGGRPMYSMLRCRVCLGNPYLIEGNLLKGDAMHDMCWCQDPSDLLESCAELWGVAKGHDAFYVRGMAGAQKAGLGVFNSEYIVFQPFQILPLYQVDYVLE